MFSCKMEQKLMLLLCCIFAIFTNVNSIKCYVCRNTIGFGSGFERNFENFDRKICDHTESEAFIYNCPPSEYNACARSINYTRYTGETARTCFYDPNKTDGQTAGDCRIGDGGHTCVCYTDFCNKKTAA